MALNRRKFFQYGITGGICLALGGLGLSMQSTKMQPVSTPLHTFSPREYSVLVAIADRMLPENRNFPAASSLSVASKVDQMLGQAHPGLQAELKLLLRLIENAAAGLLLSGAFKPFSQCTAAEQNEILACWRTSRLTFRRSAIVSLNRLCGAAYYADPATHKLVGYGGPPKEVLQVQKAMKELQ